jgi:hypothetical protein
MSRLPDAVISDVRDLLLSATDRYQSVRLAVFHTTDSALVSESLARFASNPTLKRMHEQAESGVLDELRLWSVWLQRPYRWRVEEYSSFESLHELSGGNEDEYWQYFPALRKASLLSHQPDQSATPIPLFTRWLPTAIIELLDPAILLRESSEGEAPILVESVGRRSHAGRSVLEVVARITDWNTRVPSAETLRVADDYELLVDEQAGALLRVASRFRGQEFSVYEVYDVVWEPLIDPSVFKLRVPPGTRSLSDPPSFT